MRWSKHYIPTRKETPSDAELISHKLMVRAGMIRKVAAGIYNYLPLGMKVLRRIEMIVREEMDRHGGLEIKLPIIQPAELWQRTGRWNDFGPEMFKLTDRKGQLFTLGPTHEEIISDLVRLDIRSYKELPLLLYQINDKYRDEIRPRFGLMRSREFLMKDAYSFHADQESLEEIYQHMYKCYCRILTRCRLDFTAVEAPTGLMGGNLSHEFMALADAGEDEVVCCQQCGYAANLQIATFHAAESYEEEREEQLTLVATPGKETAREVASFLKVGVERIIKTFIYATEKGHIAVLIRGNHELAEEKLHAVLADPHLARIDDEQQVRRLTGASFGSLGPIGLNMPIIADQSLVSSRNFVVGGNKEGYHYCSANFGRDVKIDRFIQIRRAAPGDHCSHCYGELVFRRGIEVGQIFQLGTKYSVALGANFLSSDGAERPLIMGCYGIGVSRILGAIIEQHHDEKGIIWPTELAPFTVIIIPLSAMGEQLAVAEKIYIALTQAGIDILLDDRNESAGVKFHDAELLGIPLQVVIGKQSLATETIELQRRSDSEKLSVSLANGITEVVAQIAKEITKTEE
ncbi:proline--tRNA ligase [Candidatus Acetothermia bacterium]|jgi:prolyl-tRNA synthetase|nr:proline--tRNA ligase [Candidatus Acetothermia bacterium]MCI2427492.1 proline--tRNA ligase [Candidatus Acetothermia bacterium]MCI2427994.1 proline--tRNA ligase [Candidatus Acetothermia bacterium]